MARVSAVKELPEWAVTLPDVDDAGSRREVKGVPIDQTISVRSGRQQFVARKSRHSWRRLPAPGRLRSAAIRSLPDRRRSAADDLVSDGAELGVGVLRP